jgi:hypothetical protein
MIPTPKLKSIKNPHNVTNLEYFTLYPIPWCPKNIVLKLRSFNSISETQHHYSQLRAYTRTPKSVNPFRVSNFNPEPETGS